MKKCCICKQDLDESCFKSNSSKKDKLQGQCIECQKQYRRQHYLDNKQKYIDKASKRSKKVREEWQKFKSTLKCSRCEENHPACLQFHHTDDNKEECVSRLIGIASLKKAIEEIKKCIVLCANCHFKEHYNMRL